MSVEAITEAAMALSSVDRARLIEKLVESLDEDEQQLDAQWATAAKRRRDEIRQGRVQAIPGEEGLARVRTLLAGR